MALETLKDVSHLGGYAVLEMDSLRERYPDKFNESGGMDYKWFEEEIRPEYFVYLRHDKNSISFTIQNGPVKENGINGCQVDTIIEAAKAILVGLDRQLPNIHTQQAILDLDRALQNLNTRTIDRTDRGVEGTSQA